MRILILGSVGSGKGTIGGMLAQKLHLPEISMGQLLRNMSPDFPGYSIVVQNMKEGVLADNRIVSEVLKMELAQDKYSNGFILDGWARQLDDLQVYDPKFDLVIYLEITEEMAIERITNRRTCPQCKKIYNLKSFPPKKECLCNVCHVALKQRTDETVEVTKKRFNDFNASMYPVLDYFRNKGMLIELDASFTPEIVFANLVKALKI